MRGAADVLAALGPVEKPFARELPQHPRNGLVRQAEETPRFGKRDPKARHLFELGTNAVQRRMPQHVRHPIRAPLVPGTLQDNPHYLEAFPTRRRSTTCVTPSVPRATVSARCLAAGDLPLPCSRTTPLFAVTSIAVPFTCASEDSCDVTRAFSDSSVSGAAVAGEAAGLARDASDAAGAAATVRPSSTRVTPSVVRASSSALERSPSPATSPLSVPTPPLLVTLMLRSPTNFESILVPRHMSAS